MSKYQKEVEKEPQARDYNYDQEHASSLDINLQDLRVTFNELLAEHEEAIAVLEKVDKYATLVEADISEHDTGWFYKWSSTTEKARDIIAKAKS